MFKPLLTVGSPLTTLVMSVMAVWVTVSTPRTTTVESTEIRLNRFAVATSRTLLSGYLTFY